MYFCPIQEYATPSNSPKKDFRPPVRSLMAEMPNLIWSAVSRGGEIYLDLCTNICILLLIILLYMDTSTSNSNSNPIVLNNYCVDVVDARRARATPRMQHEPRARWRRHSHIPQQEHSCRYCMKLSSLRE